MKHLDAAMLARFTGQKTVPGVGMVTIHCAPDLEFDFSSLTSTVRVYSWRSEADIDNDLAYAAETVLKSLHDAWDMSLLNNVSALVLSHPVWLDTPAPSANQVWHHNRQAWVDTLTLSDLKATKWAEIKAARSAAEYAGFTWDGSTFDSDPVSQQRISGAVQLATLNPAFVVNWTLQDNTLRSLDAEQMKSVGLALGAHVAVQFARAQALRVQLEAALDADAVAALGW